MLTRRSTRVSKPSAAVLQAQASKEEAAAARRSSSASTRGRGRKPPAQVDHGAGAVDDDDAAPPTQVTVIRRTPRATTPEPRQRRSSRRPVVLADESEADTSADEASDFEPELQPESDSDSDSDSAAQQQQQQLQQLQLQPDPTLAAEAAVAVSAQSSTPPHRAALTPRATPGKRVLGSPLAALADDDAGDEDRPVVLGLKLTEDRVLPSYQDPKVSVPFRSNVEYVEQPRQLIFLILLCLALGTYAFVMERPATMRENVQASAFAISGVLLMYCVLQTRDSLLIRPHPAVWRLIHGVGVLYFLCLAGLVVLDVGTAKSVLNVLFEDVGGRPTGVVSHAGDASNCKINSANLLRQLTSMWFFAHVVGWWAKMCVFRDWKFCVILSTLFELAEVSLQHVVPEFSECWWDSVFMDQLGANLLGIGAGYLTLRYLDSREYNWIAMRAKRGVGATLQRAVFRFTPFSWSHYHWDFFASNARLFQGIALMTADLVMEINAFLLIHALSIPAAAPINKLRMVVYGFLALPAVTELYAFWHGGSARLGQNTWLISAMLLLEIMMIAKFSQGKFVWTPPMHVAVPWALFFMLLSVFLVARTLKQHAKDTTPSKWLNYVGIASCVPLLYLFRGWTWDM